MTVKKVNLASNYKLHRENVTVVDSGDITDIDLGIDCYSFEKLLIQVIPSGTANPTIEMSYWSPAAAKFISENPAVSQVGLGSNVAYEFTADVHSRIAYVKVITLAAGACDIYVAGYKHTSMDDQM